MRSIPTMMTSYSYFQSILEEQKLEAVYSTALDGKRTGILIVNMDDASQIPQIAEPWFLAFNAAIEWVPVMVPADLQKAAPAIAHAVKVYA